MKCVKNFALSYSFPTCEFLSSEEKREREEVGNVYSLGPMIIHVNSIPLN